MVRYHGVLAPNASLRSGIVPEEEQDPEEHDETTDPLDPMSPNVELRERRRHTGRYLLWAELMRRVFSADVLECPKCGGRLRLVAAIIDGISARRYLEGTGLAQPRPGVVARGPPAERRVA